MPPCLECGMSGVLQQIGAKTRKNHRKKQTLTIKSKVALRFQYNSTPTFQIAEGTPSHRDIHCLSEKTTEKRVWIPCTKKDFIFLSFYHAKLTGFIYSPFHKTEIQFTNTLDLGKVL